MGEHQMTDEISLLEAMYTQRAIRYLKPDPVPDELITRIIEAGTQAPSGGNRQPWKFIVIQDPELKRRIGELYRAVFGRTRARRSGRHAGVFCPSGGAHT